MFTDICAILHIVSLLSYSADKMREEMLEIKHELEQQKGVYQELLHTKTQLDLEKDKLSRAEQHIHDLSAELEHKSISRGASTPYVLPVSQTDQIAQVCVSRERKLALFKGMDSEDVVEWVYDARRCIKNKSDSDQVAFVLEHLQGDAKREILYRPKFVKNSPDRIFEALIEVFQPVDSLPDCQETFYRRKQEAGESLFEYSIAIMQLLDRVERKSDASFEHEKTLINRFSAGVSNEALQRELRRLEVDRPDLSFWEFRKRAIDFLGKQSVDLKKKATVSEAHVGIDNYSKLSCKVDEMIGLMKDMMKKPVKVRDNSSGARGSERRCFRCRSDQHLIKDCPEKGPSNQNRAWLLNPTVRPANEDQKSNLPA